MDRTMVLADNWVGSASAQVFSAGGGDGPQGGLGAGGVGQIALTTHTIDYGQYGYVWPWQTTVYQTYRPIKLTMAEVERLKKAAKQDDALKAVLQKFTSQIEVIVSF